LSGGFYGFTILRNGLKYDYPFRESLRSLCALCERVYVALGDSDDGTEKCLGEFRNLVTVPTVWDENSRRSGLVLSAQTNIALEALRADVKKGWGVYLQADEILNERDFGRIRADGAVAEAGGCDAISFRYLHFWQSYQRVAIGWRWYPQEIRAIRLDSGIRSYGDAQSFEKVKKRFESDAFVYHYGHVREASAYEKKKADFGRWWHGDEELKKVLKKGKRRDRFEATIPYLGPQPGFMEGRMGGNAAARKKILVYGTDNDLFPGARERLQADLELTTNVTKLLSAKPENTVLLAPLPIWARFLRWLGFRSNVPRRMRSPQARDWSPEFVAILKFSERGVASR
jgi:hypothetical protein